MMRSDAKQKFDVLSRRVCVLAVAIACGFAAPFLSAAERTTPTRKPKPKPDAEAPADQSVEAIAELARNSVVTVSHYGRAGKEDGLGAGFVVSPDGLIATCLHVIGEARPISVQLANGKRYEVTEVHASDRKLDLALIRINSGKLAALRLGDSDTLKQGAQVVAMGNPLGLEHSVVQGVVSARRNFDGVEMVQLAIPIEQGNSGGPLLDRQGRVRGILTMKSALSANLGFAMPVNELKRLLDKPNPVPMNRWLSIGALNPREWTPLMGARWSQRAGRIQVEGLGTGFGGRSLCLSQKPVPPLPYEVAVTVKLEDESGAAGLVFASDGSDKHYGFYPTGGQLRLTRFDGPSVFLWTILQTVTSPHYRPGDWNTIKVRCEKEKIRCYVNEHLVIESDDHEFTSGQAGLAKFRDTKASFKDFQLGAHLSPALAQFPDDLAASITKQIENVSDRLDPKLVAALQPRAEASQAVLAERARKLVGEAAQLRKLATAVHRQAVQAQLVKLFDAPEKEIDLFHAALLVARLDNADVDIEAYRHQLAEMARELAARLPAQANDAAKLAALTNYLFAENGFHGSRTDYYNRANSYMNQVLDDREGLPITLSVLFVELAHRIGLENVAGVSVPAHFMVKYVPKNGPEQLIDVFDEGRVLTRTQAAEKVAELADGALLDAHLKPATKREIIIRMLRNLLSIAQAAEAPAESLRYLDVIVALASDAPTDRLNRARLRLQGGDTSGAKQDLKWLIDHEPPGVDLDRVTELYHSL